ncbi:MAG: hypothetical protein R3F56_26440 [Planctomycetota bacterium]
MAEDDAANDRARRSRRASPAEPARASLLGLGAADMGHAVDQQHARAEGEHVVAHLRPVVGAQDQTPSRNSYLPAVLSVRLPDEKPPSYWPAVFSKVAEAKPRPALANVPSGRKVSARV